LVSLILACTQSSARTELLLVADPQPYSTEALYRYICSQLGVECRTFSQHAFAGRMLRKLAGRLGFANKLFGDLEVDVAGMTYPGDWRPANGVLDIVNDNV